MVIETPKIKTEAPKMSKIKKQETDKNDRVMQTKKNKIQSNQHSPTSALKQKNVDSDLKERKIEEQTNIVEDTNQKWDNKRKPDTANKKLGFPDINQKNQKKIPEIEIIKYEESYNDDTEIIQNTPIKTEKNETLEEIEMEQEKNITDPITISKGIEKVESDQNIDIEIHSEALAIWLTEST